MDKRMYIGATYYPEQYPQERWAEDIRLMKEAGVSILRMSESIWTIIEPKDGEFDFTIPDGFAALAHEAGIRLVMTTPMEASPIWLRHKHPEIVITDEFGHIHGGRGRHCHTNKDFLFYSERVVETMAKHYADHPAVIGWEIDNELRAVACYCRECVASFRQWLQARYGSLDALNKEWGSIFWSQLYRDWEEVTPPSGDQMIVSVSQKVDFKRFTSDTTVTYSNRQAAIIRKYAPHHFVTHNSPAVHGSLSLTDLSKQLDFLSWDLYPHVDADNIDTVFGHDYHRGCKQDNFWVMEQKNGYFNYSDYNLAIEPGIVRMWAHQDIARGANAVLFYNWRSTRFNYEQNPNGLLRHDGSPRRAYYEMKQLIAELGNYADELLDTKVEAPVALIHSLDNYWGFEAHKQYTDFDYRQHIKSYYKTLLKMGITADIVEPLMDLSRYKVVIAPSIMMVSQEMKEHFKQYVENGGCLIIGARSGMKTWANITIDTPWPGLLSDLAGIAIDEFEVLPSHLSNTISYKDRPYEVNVWLDMIEPTTAETLAVYTRKFYQGRTAITRNRVGKGEVYYVGVMGSDALLADLLADVADACRVERRAMPDGVFVTRRSNDQVCFTFYVNINQEPARVVLAEQGTDAITGKRVSGEAVVGGLDVLVVRSTPIEAEA